MVRPSLDLMPLPDGLTIPHGLSIERVVDADGLVDFERSSAAGFGSPEQPPFSWHAPPVLADPRLALWRGRFEGRTVSTSMSFSHAGVIGVYGVSTVPEARRRGYATALTAAALGVQPSLPSVLQPSQMGEPLYAALGYGRFTAFRSWVRSPLRG
jgi:Acetyltransferase (GNAT) domain